MTDDAWLDALRTHREQRDRYLAGDRNSPVPPDQRGVFDDLGCFDPDPDLRSELELREYDNSERITAGILTDGEREYLAWTRFELEVHGESYALDAYRVDADEGRLWVSFRDETNAEGIYGAGHYLDLEAADRTGDGRWTVDFDYAYNPFYAYPPRYEYPLVPMENWLEVRIEAGEKDYEGPGGGGE